nr:MAG TPA: replisome organizer protein [Caudoviricetes sp.]
MSINAILAAGYVTHSPAGDHLKASTISTLKALAFCTGKASNACYPSIQTLQDMTGHSENTVRAALKDLEALGFITCTARVGASNIYTLQIDTMRSAHRRRRWSNTYEAGDPYTPGSNITTTVEELDDSERVEASVEPVEEETPVQAELIPAPAKKAKKRSTTTAALDEEFEEFYKHAYPRKMEPLKARRAFEKAVKNGADPRDIIEGARRFAAATATKGKTYIPYPASWLNAGGWMNEAGDIAPVEPTPWQKKTARLVQSMQAAAVVNNAPALTGVTHPAPTAPLAIEPGYI